MFVPRRKLTYRLSRPVTGIALFSVLFNNVVTGVIEINPDVCDINKMNSGRQSQYEMNVLRHSIFSNWLIDYPLLRSWGIPRARILTASTNVRAHCYKGRGGLSLPICTTEHPQKETEAKSKATTDDKKEKKTYQRSTTLPNHKFNNS
jgi:hypothetical protein